MLGKSHDLTTYQTCIMVLSVPNYVMLVANPCFAQRLDGTEIWGFCNFASAPAVQLCFWGGGRESDCSRTVTAVSELQFLDCNHSTRTPSHPYKQSCSAIGELQFLHCSHSPSTTAHSLFLVHNASYNLLLNSIVTEERSAVLISHRYVGLFGIDLISNLDVQ